MDIANLTRETAIGAARLMHNLKPVWWSTYEEAYRQLTDIEESIGTVGWVLQEGACVKGFALFRELKGYLSLELECCGYDDNGTFQLEHKLGPLLDEAATYARSKGYTTLRTGMSSSEFNIDGQPIADLPAALSSLSTERVDYHYLLRYGFRVIGIHPNAYGGNVHLILLVKEL